MFRPELGAEGELAAHEAPRGQSNALYGRWIKRLFDVVGATALLVIFVPVFLVLAVCVRCSSAGPVFYSHHRVGRSGKYFKLLKFRSMRVDAEKYLSSYLASNADAKREWEEFHKLKNDPRITIFGNFIRKTSLDELPQLLNVLKGEMSLVGPRPVTEAEMHRYGEHWHTYCAVPPGITGLWQVSGRSHVSYADRVQLDIAYVQQWSVWLDFKILVRTVKVVLTRDGSH